MDVVEDLIDDPNYMVLDPSPQLDDALILRLQYDLATGMHNSEVIARRYGLGGADSLREYLRQHPQIVFEARKLRTMFQSDEATEARIRTKFLRATEQLIIPIASLVADPRTPITSRIDGFKQIQRGAGVDGAATGKDTKTTGTAFSLTINFAGGRAQRIEGTTVLDAEAIPLPKQPPRLTTGSDEDNIAEEDV
jgi:hypothetical protein